MKEQSIVDDVTKDKGRKRVYLILGFMIAAQMGLIVYDFAFKKEGWHSDELWSYGYANSYYQKDVFQDKDGILINHGVWTDADVLRDYLVVNEGEQFAYDSVYQNQINDLSPPLHSMILHTICSFFPERFSSWYSFSINIAAFLVCMLFLYKTARLLKGDFFALCCCALYGFSLGARDTYIYLRMYAMCSALVMVYVYNLVKYIMEYEKGGKVLSRRLAYMCLAAFVAFLTHYHMISFVGAMTFLACVVLLFRKKIKLLFTYGFSMLITLLLSIAVFPSILRMQQNQSGRIVSDNQQNMNYTFELRMRLLLNYITKKMYNIYFPVYQRSALPAIIFGVCVTLLIWLIPLMFLLRDTRFMKGAVRRVRFFIHHIGAIVRYYWRRINWYYVVFFLTIMIQVVVVGETTNVYGMAEYEDRYLMHLYPVTALLGCAAGFTLYKIIVRKKKYAAFLVLLTVIVMSGMNLYNRVDYKLYFILRNEEGEPIEKCLEGRDCIYVAGDAWMLTAYAPYLMHADEYFETLWPYYQSFEEEYKERMEDRPVVLVFDCSFLQTGYSEWLEAGGLTEEQEELAKEQERIRIEKYKEIIAYFEDLEPSTSMQRLSTMTVYGRLTVVYLINP